MSSTVTGLPDSWAHGGLWDMTRRERVVTFIGAGGKTTCLQALTREIESSEQRVIATTTTKVYPEKRMNCWKNPNPPPYERTGSCFWHVDVMEESGKWIGPSREAVDDAIELASAVHDVGAINGLPWHSGGSMRTGLLHQRTVPVLPRKQENRPCAFPGRSTRTVPVLPWWVIEGDGARGLKLKCWESHEPQIPRRSNCVVLVLDGGLWGGVLQAEYVHRPAVCPDLVGQVWNAEQAWRYFLRSPVFAPQYQQMSWVILLNSPGKNLKNEDLLDLRPPFDPLLDLWHKWIELQRQVFDQSRPKHLRLAVGDAKEGEMRWFDLW